MTLQKSVTDDQLGQYYRRTSAIADRLGKSLSFDQVMDALQIIHDGQFKSVPAPKYSEENGVIYFTVTPNGKTGQKWIESLEKQGFQIGTYAKSVLISPDFKPAKSRRPIEIRVLKGTLFSDSDHTTENIRAEADKLKLGRPNAEVACLIREKFTDEELEAMGLWYIVAMHEPIKDSIGALTLLSAHRNADGRWLDACYESAGHRWSRESGFAFVVSQV